MLLWLFLIKTFATVVFARPGHIFPRNDTPPAVITTRVDFASPNGTINTDNALSSSFQTLLYVPTSAVALTSLTGRGLQPRLLYHCRSPTATFHHSHCIHQPGQSGGMQRYIIYCREVHPTHSHTPMPLGESGVCNTREICVDSWIGDRITGLSLARCVPQDAFRPMDLIDDDIEGVGHGSGQRHNGGSAPIDTGDSSEEDNSGHIGGEKRRKLDRGFVLGGKQASVVVSQADASTPMGVNKIELDAIGDEHNTRMCQNCFEIRTKSLAPDTTELNMQATLVTAGTGIAASVMWVALFSG